MGVVLIAIILFAVEGPAKLCGRCSGLLPFTGELNREPGENAGLGGLIGMLVVWIGGTNGRAVGFNRVVIGRDEVSPPATVPEVVSSDVNGG